VEFVECVEFVGFVEFVEFIGFQWRCDGNTVEIHLGDWGLEAVRMILRE
jgi:hypothetical protein